MSRIKFNKLFKQREKIRQLETELNFIEILTENERAMLEFIASRAGTRITDISDNNYFFDQSFSTIKRGVLTLQKNNLVMYVPTTDQRERVMVANLEF
jgi:hypothetical protein